MTNDDIDYKFNSTSFAILSLLNDNKKNDKLNSLTRDAITKELQDLMKKATVIFHTQMLYKLGYIDEGMLNKKSKTFYITKKGIELIEGGINNVI